MAAPEGILCSKTNEWVLEDNNIVLIGLTDKIVEQYGDIVFIELPEIDTYFSKDEIFATVESVKGAGEIYMPVSGKIVEVNEQLINSPDIINESPYEAWIVKIQPDDFQNESQDLLEYDDYIEDV